MLLFVAAAAAPSAADASTATAEAREENGFGRVVLTFDRLPAYRKELDAGVFVLWFDEPVEAELGEIPKDLPEYIGLTRRDPDGRAFRLALNRTFLVNLMEAGNQLYIDILPPGWKGLPPALPTHVLKALSRAAAEAERKRREEVRQREAAKLPYKLEVRLLRQPTFSRIVFDWNRFVTVNLSRQGRNVTVAFGARADADLAALKVDPPKYLRAAKLADKKGGGMEMMLIVDDDVGVRGFREGHTFVVDLTGPDVPADTAAGKAALKLGAGAKEKDAQLPEDSKDRTWLPPEDAGKRTPPGAKKPAPVVTSTRELKPQDIPASEAKEATRERKKADTRKKPEVAKRRAPEPPRPAGPPIAVKPAPPPGAPPAKPAGPASAKARKGAVVVTADDSNGNMRLTIPFPGKVAAAAFRRGQTIWLVFDSDAKLDVEDVKDAVGAKVVAVQHIRAGSMQYVRLRLSRAWLTYVAAHDNAWVVDIGDMASGQAETLTLQRKLRQDKRSVIGIRLKHPGRIHWLPDPDIGDRLAVVTAFPPQRAVSKPQDFVEFRALATAHGIAIRPNSDDIAVRLQLDEVVITRRRGLTLSAGNVHQYVAGRKALANTARAGFLDADRWGVKDPAKFSDRVHALQRAVALSAENEKNVQRFALARLYFSQGYSMETLGVLERMAQVDPAVASDPAYGALRGGVLTLLGRVKEARRNFEVHALANNADVALWRGLLDVADRNWESALQNFEEGADVVYSYTPDLQARFRLAAARSALWLKRLNRAADQLDAVPKKFGPEALRMEMHLLRGWYFASIGRTDEALEAYDRVLKSDQRPAVAEAELRTLKLLLKHDRIPRPKALRNLERLQLVWRGDGVELGAMRVLAHLYVQERRYRDAFTTMKNAVIAYPESRRALLIQDEMKEVFKSLYLNGVAEKLPPVESLGLYYDFRELTPVGRQGDEMIRRLADRLVRFDLLDQAGALLDHQVSKRLKGAARSQVATRLAMVHLMNHKPELALRVLRRTRQAGLPNDLHRSRNLLEARALGELGRAEAAIEILNTLQGGDVERLKADVLWTSQQWSKAGEQLEKMLGARWQEPGALSDRERFDVLRAAISFALAGDQFAVDRVRKKFYEKMVKTRDAESFVVVTRPVKSQGVSFRELAKQIAATDTLDAFMKEFRQRYEPDPSTTSALPKKPARQPAG